MTNEIAKKYLYDSLRDYIINGEYTPSLPRHIRLYRKMFFRINELENEAEKELETYKANIHLNAFAIPIIELIVLACSSDKICKLSKQEVIEWFFSFEVSITSM
jgi:hypothetical protein